MRRFGICLFFFAASLKCQAVHPQINRRLDPHGTAESEINYEAMARFTNCKICHTANPKKTGAIMVPAEKTCILCHPAIPHSGAAEHLGKKFSEAGPLESNVIDCLSCHTPHRDALNFKEGASAFLKFEKKLPEGFMEKGVANPMLKRTCQDCHKWH